MRLKTPGEKRAEQRVRRVPLACYEHNDGSRVRGQFGGEAAGELIGVALPARR